MKANEFYFEIAQSCYKLSREIAQRALGVDGVDDAVIRTTLRGLQGLGKNLMDTRAKAIAAEKPPAQTNGTKTNVGDPLAKGK